MEDGLLLLNVPHAIRGVAAGFLLLLPLDLTCLDVGGTRLGLLLYGPPRKDEDLALGGVRGDVLCREEVQHEEEHAESDQDSKVPPAVRVVEPVRRRDVVRPLDEVQPRH